MKIVVTGANGFIGEALSHTLTDRGHDVVRLSRSCSSHEPASRVVITNVEADDLADVFLECRPQAVIHAAGPASVSGSFENPLATLRGSSLGWAQVLDGLRRAAPNARAYSLSSAAVYGSPAAERVSEDCAADPISPYGFNKRICELISEDYRRCFGLAVTDCRLFSVFGPGQRRLLIWELFNQLLGPASSPVILRGTGREMRDYLYIDDLADILARVVTSAVTPPATINVASGFSSSVITILGFMQEALGQRRRVITGSTTPRGDPVHWEADVSLLKALVPDWEAPKLQERLGDCLAVWLRGTH